MSGRSDAAFLSALADGTLAELTHDDHIRYARLVLRELPLLPALERICRELAAFAAAKGRPEVFHETITWAFTLLIHERMTRGLGDDDLDTFLELNADLRGGIASLLSRYDPATLDSEIARRTFVLPDACSTERVKVVPSEACSTRRPATRP